MSYKVTITKTRPNENFAAELKEYSNRSSWQNGAPMPVADIVEKSLEVTLTDEEFAAIKKAALEAM